jgi:hypothetical protein
MSDKHFAKFPTQTTQNKHKRQISVLSAGFEPAIPSIKRVPSYAVASGIAKASYLEQKFLTHFILIHNIELLWIFTVITRDSFVISKNST